MPNLVRDDIKHYMHFYIQDALKTIGDGRRMYYFTPLQLLDAMHKFWHLTGCAQDTIVICLEVQQLYLYVHLYRELLSWHKLLPRLSAKGLSNNHHFDLKQLKQQVTYGAKFERDNDVSRIFFIDILVRRLLFWACINQFKLWYKEEMHIYASLLALEPVTVDSWQDIEFGNIDESD